MNNKKITPIGLDVGFGDVKAALIHDGKFQTVVFPAVLGQAQELSNYAILGRHRRRATRLTYAGVEYYVGHDALRHSRTQAGRQDRARIGSIDERVLALAALARLGVGITDVFIVTGLPILWFDDRRKLARSLRGEHTFTWNHQERTITVHGITTVPQPLGGFYYHFLDDRGLATVPEAEMLRTYGFFDIGWNTTDLSAIRELRPVERWSGGERVGVRNVIEIVGDQVQRQHGLDLQPHEIDAAIRHRRIEVYGQYHDIGEIVDNAITSLAQQEVSAATRLWGNGERMTQILIFGGGGAILGLEIRRAFPRNSIILGNAALANALGFCRFAQRKEL